MLVASEDAFAPAALLFAPVLIGDDRGDRVDRLFEPWNKSFTPGCSGGVVQRGALIFKRGYGMAELEHNVPNSPSSLF